MQEKNINILIQFFQLLICFITLFGIYMLLVLLDNDEIDLINEIGVFIIQPIIGAAIIAITMTICFVIGLPLRLIRRFRNWWIDRPLIPLTGLAIGITCFAFAFKTSLMEQKEVIINNESRLKLAANSYLSISGWFIIAFSLLHFYPKPVINFFSKRDYPDS